MDSADTWAHPELFQLDINNVPLAVAGCPPDGFSATGQLWGNPLYKWDYHRQTQYYWWIGRMAYCFRLYDVVRIDHFRGFDEYFSIPYGAENATCGHWEKEPGVELFYRMKEILGEREVIAEDAFDTRDTGSASDYLPHNYTENCVAYTGTHDNETVIGWTAFPKRKGR